MKVLDEQGVKRLVEQVKALIPDGGGGGLFTFEIDDQGDLYQIYNDGETPQQFEIGEDGCLYAVFDGGTKVNLGSVRGPGGDVSFATDDDVSAAYSQYVKWDAA